MFFAQLCSEFGMPAFPDYRTIEYWMKDVPGQEKQLYFGSPIMAQHNRAGSHQARFGTLLAENFRPTGDFER
jgi:beta-mannosidase